MGAIMSDHTQQEFTEFDDPVTLNPVIGLRLSDLLRAGEVVVRQALMQPSLVAEQAARFNQELVRILLGRSELDAHPKDRRFADEAFRDNRSSGNGRASSSTWSRTRWRRPISCRAIRRRYAG